MAESLGEKLRKAREERDISISEVAEQTRISALYLEAIENDDYRPLPGGIFNKGFVKSFAKYVGVDEGEALLEYSRIAASQEAAEKDPIDRYKPEVLTDDRSGPSLLPTIIFSIVILGLLAWGIILLVNYLQEPASPANSTPANSASSNTNIAAPTPERTPVAEVEEIRLRIETSAEELAIQSTVDGKVGAAVLQPGKGWETEANESIRISYYKGLADTLNITVNGKKVETPLPPSDWPRVGFEFEINKGNIREILETGKIAVIRQQNNPDLPVNTAPPANSETNQGSTG